MVAAALYLVLALLSLLAAINAVRPPLVDSHPSRRPPWLPVMLTTETIPIRILYRLLVSVAAWALGALDTIAGRAGLALMTLSTGLLVIALRRSLRAGRAMRAALATIAIEHDPRGSVAWFHAVLAYPYRVPGDVERIPDIEYAPGLRLDLYRPAGSPPAGPVPTVVEIHGGGWHGGHRRQQAMPLLYRVARRGWVAVSVSYPLAPAATWPEPMIALKRAVDWLKTHGGRYGVDPDGIVVTGGSAGGHLAALLALTAGDPEYQPGFESADTSVAGAVPFYGIFDLINRNATRDEWPFIARELMKSDKSRDERRWRSASPLDRVHAGAPPFLLVHGSHDALVPARESVQLRDALVRVGAPEVAYAEIPGATHSFDIPHSPRSHHVAAGVISFVAAVTGSAAGASRPRHRTRADREAVRSRWETR